MTLSPVFRSPGAVRLLEDQGVWERLGPAIDAQVRAVQVLQGDLRRIIDERHLTAQRPLPAPGDTRSPVGLAFLQEFFFLILFRSLFESLGISRERLGLYAELNFCIKGTITAADNLFDDQAKSLLPLAVGRGSRYMSILQLMCFERLLRRSCDRAVAAGVMERRHTEAVLLGLLNRMAAIGALEGSEEGGVEDVPEPEVMVEKVHRVRGGALFALAFVAPRALEEGELLARVESAEPAVARLGTAFQIVDDLTDFEVDLRRRSHNLLVSQIRHRGTPAERKALERLWNGGSAGETPVEDRFLDSATAVLDRAHGEARASFEALESLGFWFPAQLAESVVHAIVGLDGVARMEALAQGRA